MKMLYLFFLIIFFFSGCRKGKVLGVNNEILTNNDIVLFIIEANNSLKYEAFQTINRLEKSIVSGQNILVYINSDVEYSYLLKVKKDDNDFVINSDTLKRFNKVEDNLKMISTCIKWIEDEKDERISGLVLWSHGTSWYPDTIMRNINSNESYLNKYGIKLKSFGDEAGKKIDIQKLAIVIPQVDFLIFDACSMGTLEVLYEFKDKAKYIIASPTETLAESIPYQNSAAFLKKSVSDLKIICRNYMQYYKNYTDFRRSASICLYETEKFGKLASRMKDINLKKIASNIDFDTTDVQRLDFSENFPVPIYDYYSFLRENYEEEELNILSKVAEDCILFKDSTAKFLDYKITEFSGFGISIISKDDRNFDYYRKLKWVIDTKSF